MDGTQPVKEGEEYNLKVEKIGAKGDGIGLVAGFAIFMKGAHELDRTHRVRVTKVMEKYAFSEIIQ